MGQNLNFYRSVLIRCLTCSGPKNKRRVVDYSTTRRLLIYDLNQIEGLVNTELISGVITYSSILSSLR
ncbi:hypothetical protein Lepto7375DRAFT_4060 [Leptolyngbya sp. PCC 7375]|nr:hypothetical protein Lepto7375DRAFT_4060 [Leptolyngbya sp. PCC 7375]